MDQEQKDAMAERLEPTHLTGEEMRETLTAEVKELAGRDKEGKKEDPERDSKTQKKYPFDFEWTDENGKVWKGHFVNQILDIRTRQLVGVQRARFALGMPVESLDELTLEINLMVAHLTLSLTEKPVWAEDLLAMDDVRLLQEIYTEVLAHEARFRGREPAETTG